jgi:uncharacterized membrane protein (DUF4010 family)
VTVTNARRAANEEAPAGVLAAGVAIASGISFVRVIVIVAALQPALLWLIAPAPLVATLVAGVVGFLPLRGQARRTKPATPTRFRNPFALWSVIAFAIFLGFVVVAARIVGERFGATGVILSAAIAGFADVDAITVSIAKLTSISAQSAALAILTAVATNTVSKLVVGVPIGSGRFALCLAAFVLACLAAAGIAFWITLSFVPP